jgi:hypothetical protein
MNQIVLSMLTLGLSLIPTFGWAFQPNAEQAMAIAEIEKLGGKVTVDEKSPDDRPISVQFNGNASITDSLLANLKRLPQPKRTSQKVCRHQGGATKGSGVG